MPRHPGYSEIDFRSWVQDRHDRERLPGTVPEIGILLLVGNGGRRAARGFKSDPGIILKLYYFSAGRLWLTLRRCGELPFRCQRAGMSQRQWRCGSMFETSSLPGPITSGLFPSGRDNPRSTFWPFVVLLTTRRDCWPAILESSLLRIIIGTSPPSWFT